MPFGQEDQGEAVFEVSQMRRNIAICCHAHTLGTMIAAAQGVPSPPLPARTRDMTAELS